MLSIGNPCNFSVASPFINKASVTQSRGNQILKISDYTTNTFLKDSHIPPQRKACVEIYLINLQAVLLNVNTDSQDMIRT